MTTEMKVTLVANAQSPVSEMAKLQAAANESAKSFAQVTKAATDGAKAATGSFNALEQELKQNLTQLRGLKQGTSEFAAQKAKVDELRGSMEKAKSATATGIQQQSGIGKIVDDFTSSLSGTVSTIVSVGAIAASLKQDLENIKRVNENKRLSEVEFGKAISARSISNLGEEERLAVRPLALNLADELGLNAGGIVEALGTLRSSGADNILEAGSFLREAAKAFPQDLAQATAIAQGALIEARATGNRNAQETVGGLVQSQAVSQVTDAVSFSKAFSANTAGAVAILKLSAEKAREEASIFSVLEPKSADVAATSQQAFFRQLQNFVPEASVKLKTGGEAKTTAEERQQFMAATFEQRMRLIETNANLQTQFIGGLADTGQNAIIRRIRPTAEDQASFDTIRQGIMSDADAAKALVKLQGEASTSGAFAIAEGQRKASEETANLRAEGRAKLEAELETIFTNVQERTRAFVGGTVVSGAERFGARTEQFVTGADRAQVLLDTVKFRAASATNPEDRKYLEQQVQNLELLQRQMVLQTESAERGNQILEQMLQKMNENKGGGPAAVAAPVKAPPVPRRPIAAQ